MSSETSRRWWKANPDKAKAIRARHHAKHRERRNAESRAWRANNKDHFARTTRAGHLRKEYGLTPEQYATMLAEQDERCAICGEPETSVQRGKVVRLAVDHNHQTHKVRALLCSACNRAIEAMKESPERLRAAANYLETWTEGFIE